MLFENKQRSKRAVAKTMLLCGISSLVMATQAVANDEEEAFEMDEIIVSALKKEQSLQDAPATIDTFGGDFLKESGITNTQDLEFSVPGLQFGNQGFNGSRIGLRGISSDRSFTGDDAAVAVHINGVFLPYSGLALARLFDIERVEVLKGPQGTLYGRNATAGTINIISASPELDELKGYAEVSYGNYNTVRGNGALNVPVAENHALRFTFSAANGDGYIENTLDSRTFGDENYFAAGASYYGEMGDWTVKISGQYANDKSTQLAAVVPDTGNPDRAFFGLATKTDFFQTVIDADVDELSENFYITGLIEGQVGEVGIRLLSGYADYKVDFATDSFDGRFNPAEVGLPPLDSEGMPFGQFYATQDGHSFSQEINLFGEIGKFEYQVGAFYMTQEVVETRLASDAEIPVALPQFSGLDDDFLLFQEGDAYGLFGDFTFHVSDDLRFGAGIRWNKETKDQRQIQTFQQGGVTLFFVPGLPLVEPQSTDQQLEFTWEDPSWRASVEWDINDDSMVYFKYDRGFRSGAIGGLPGLDDFFDVAFGGPGGFGLAPLDPETVDAFELGSKNVFLDGRLVVNVAAFFNNFKDQLIFAQDPVTFRVLESNIGRTEIYGMDAYITYDITDKLNFSFNGEWLNTTVKELDPTISLNNLAVGSTLPRAPEISFSTALVYRTPTQDLGLSDIGELSLRLEYSFKDEHFLNLNLTELQESVGLVNASIRLDANDSWYIFLNVRNLTNEEYFLQGGPNMNRPNARFQGRVGQPRRVFGGIGFSF